MCRESVVAGDDGPDLAGIHQFLGFAQFGVEPVRHADIQRASASLAALSMESASSRLAAIGFSTRTCLPLVSATRQTWRKGEWGGRC